MPQQHDHNLEHVPLFKKPGCWPGGAAVPFFGPGVNGHRRGAQLRRALRGAAVWWGREGAVLCRVRGTEQSGHKPVGRASIISTEPARPPALLRTASLPPFPAQQGRAGGKGWQGWGMAGLGGARRPDSPLVPERSPKSPNGNNFPNSHFLPTCSPSHALPLLSLSAYLAPSQLLPGFSSPPPFH